jgi:hypothetical protein
VTGGKGHLRLAEQLFVTGADVLGGEEGWKRAGDDDRLTKSEEVWA